MLTFKEKIGYGLGDTASNLVLKPTMLFLAYFYTDVFGISAAAMGTIFLVSRLLDAITDPLMGMIVDRTRTRHGQFRPYILWCAVPFGIILAATFYTPDWSYTGRVIYATATYIALTLVYTAVNVPYCSMPATITSEPSERHSLQSWRFFMAAIAALIVSGIALPLVKILGKGNEAQGYFSAMAILGGLGVLCFLLCFTLTKENIKLNSGSHSNVREDIKVLFQNTQWRIVILFKIVGNAANTIRVGAMMYFVKYVMDRPELAPEFVFYGSLAAMLGSLMSAKLLGKYDRISSCKLTVLVYIILNIVVFLTPNSNIEIIFFLNMLFMFFYNLTNPLQWLMASDVVDYEEYRSGHRLDGLIFSTYLFGIKMGLAVGGALLGWSLHFAHYQPGVVIQDQSVSLMVKAIFCIIPSVFSALQIALLFIYKLDSKTVNDIASNLKLKRQKQQIS
ncbi:MULTISPECIES: glycoside-pentoside-hexuronide (GPH):cation symporter [unclassified Pseudocitrobacter]|uniref:glycoside-pentoside-hexuronide (GPH):cation symporter n=1 Tax=unclassified Pseudocitrobacter TaxID=2638778 RepID=UPI0023E3A408|nr:MULTISPECIES: glycoside-pentoside-hexuronide (GPH):cation symporter [unclassified Pseudocitrobacter]MDF3830175.1 glycoside-pentoside-hexuronide (GPH):cation symporter [Pseudocitrobacter sp. 2023EL-00150]MEC5376335.1 glycoside-pentoside-hexuronide (GPH):cation symporter [Pseudocitrobacter sp. MW920760]